ncbi:hypothetical protein [Coprothermobacter platensis]|uniref:hypothetical protein n=1 Tax=Coprothermobacter platensis TaxID=108819 RepID=UPI0003655012|nr:hypothetical protein [Coprothermobacter platensis]
MKNLYGSDTKQGRFLHVIMVQLWMLEQFFLAGKGIHGCGTVHRITKNFFDRRFLGNLIIL